MANAKNNEPTIVYSPEQQAVLDIDRELHGFNFNLWAHGTPSDEPESFFETGLRVSKDGEHTLGNYAVPLDEANISEINDWGHKRGSGKPNVVLLAYPFNEVGHGLTHRIIQNQILDHKAGVLPPKFIVGFYNATTGQIVRNPDFVLTEQSQSETLAMIKRKEDSERTACQASQAVGRTAVSEIASPIPATSVDIGDVW